MSRIAHPAGALHAEAANPLGPDWLPVPDDVNALLPQLWPSGVTRRDDGVLTVRGVPVTELAARFGTPAYVLDEEDFRSRARAFRDAFSPGVDVYYAGKAFLCRAVTRWVAEEGLFLLVASGGELEVALAAGFPPARIAMHGNNKSDAEIDRALRAAVGRLTVDNLGDIGRIGDAARAAGRVVPVMIRVTVGVEAHTHEFIATAHEDQKFGLSLASGAAAEAVRLVLATEGVELLGLHSHIGSQIYDPAGFEVAARRVVGFYAEMRKEHDVELAELGLGGGFGIAYTSLDDPMTPAALAGAIRSAVVHECAEHSLGVPRLSIEPGRAIAGPSTFTLYRAGTVKSVELGAHGSRRYVAVDGGMSDNIRPALYDAAYSATLASRVSAAEPVLSRVVGKHCESGDIVVRDEFLPDDVTGGDLIAVPGTGAYCRSMASNYNHVPRPPVVAVAADGRARLIVRRETVADLLALDLLDTAE